MVKRELKAFVGDHRPFQIREARQVRHRRSRNEWQQSCPEDERLSQRSRKMAKNTSVLGIYPDRRTVSDAITVLHRAGYRPVDIAILSAENQGSKDFAHEKSSKAPQGAATGALVGAFVGAILGWLMAAGVVAVPGLE